MATIDLDEDEDFEEWRRRKNEDVTPGPDPNTPYPDPAPPPPPNQSAPSNPTPPPTPPPSGPDERGREWQRVQDAFRNLNLNLGETDEANFRGKNPEDVKKFADDLVAQAQKRAAPTFSAGGRGGSADTDYNAQADPGWSKNAGGQWVRGGPTSTPPPVPPPNIADRQQPGFGGGGGGQPGFGGGAGRDAYNLNAPGTQFGNDPYSKLLEDIAKQQLTNLQQPQTNPALDRLLAFLDQRFTNLSTQPGYSPEDLAILRTQAFEPLEAYRQASQRRALERTSARGMLPSSGVLEDESRLIDTDFDKARGALDRDLAINAISRRDQNLAQAQMIGQLAGIQIPQLQRAEDQGRRNEMLNVGNLLYQMPRQSMMDALAVVNGSPAPPDLFQQAVQLLNAQQNQQGFNDQRNAAFWQQLGELFGNLFR